MLGETDGNPAHQLTCVRVIQMYRHIELTDAHKKTLENPAVNLARTGKRGEPGGRQNFANSGASFCHKRCRVHAWHRIRGLMHVDKEVTSRHQSSVEAVRLHVDVINLALAVRPAVDVTEMVLMNRQTDVIANKCCVCVTNRK